MAACPCCCTNGPQGGEFCICEDYTQMAIEVAGMTDPTFSCNCLNVTVVVDLVSETQVFEVNNCTNKAFLPNSRARVVILPTLCGYIANECRIVSPGFGGSLERTANFTQFPYGSVGIYSGTGGPGTPATTGGVSSNPNEPCEEFSSRIGREVSAVGTGDLSFCAESRLGSWSLQ